VIVAFFFLFRVSVWVFLSLGDVVWLLFCLMR